MSELFLNLYSTVIFLVVLSILIIVHEWGHFITAKKLGVAVKRFAIGFGPTLFSRNYKGTEFAVCLIPLGGYVKMAGDEKNECKGLPDEFYSQSPGKRAMIVVNGPIINYCFAYLSLFIVFMIGYPGLSTKIAAMHKGGPAFNAGFKINDKIIGVDGKKIYGWNNMQRILKGREKKPFDIEVERDGNVVNMTIVPDIIEKKDLLGQMRYYRDLGIDNISAKVGEIIPGYPAQEAGLKQGDIILSVDGSLVNGWNELQDAIGNAKTDLIELKVLREEKDITFDIKPNIVEIKDEEGNPVKLKRIGIAPHYAYSLFKFNPLRSLQYAAQELWYITAMTYKTLFKIFTGSKTARESMAGPVGIFYIVRGASQEGFSHLVFIVGIISASLAIFNLLPIIPLDGGHLFILLIEKIKGRALSERADLILGKIGFSLIILLAIFVFYVDFARFGLFDKIIHIFVR